MIQKQAAIFFLAVFTAFIISPSIIIAIDSSADISFIYTINEEEEELGHEVLKQGKVVFLDSKFFTEHLKDLKKIRQYSYLCKSYAKPHLNLIYPPPEFI